MPSSQQTKQIQKYLSTFDQQFEKRLAAESDSLGAIAFRTLGPGHWQVHYDEILRAEIVVKHDALSQESEDRKVLRIYLDLGFQKLSEGAWIPWQGFNNSGFTMTSSSNISPAAGVAKELIERLQREANRPEIAKALRIAAANPTPLD